MVIEIDSGKLKFLCSYNGKIVPRPGDGLLRYVGGLNRVLAVDRSISYAELMVKLVEFCEFSVDLKCQLPDGDLETLITIKSDVELASLIEEYDRAWLSSNPAPSKIRAVLTHPKSLKKISPTPSVDFSSPKSAGSPVSVPFSRRIPSPWMSYRVRSAPRYPCKACCQHSTPHSVDFYSPKSVGSPVSVHCSCRIPSPPQSYRVGSVPRHSCRTCCQYPTSYRDTHLSSYRHWN